MENTIRETKNRMGAQALLFVIFLMVLVGIFSNVLSDLWQKEVSMRKTNKYIEASFYLAQAGLERGKVEILYDVNMAGGAGGSYDSGWIYELDPDYPAFVAGTGHLYDDGHVFRYKYIITDPTGGGDRQVIGMGEVGIFVNNGGDGVEGTNDDPNEVVAQRKIYVEIDGVLDGDGDSQDDDMTATQIIGTWQEI